MSCCPVGGTVWKYQGIKVVISGLKEIFTTEYVCS